MCATLSRRRAPSARDLSYAREMSTTRALLRWRIDRAIRRGEAGRAATLAEKARSVARAPEASELAVLEARALVWSGALADARRVLALAVDLPENADAERAVVEACVLLFTEEREPARRVLTAIQGRLASVTAPFAHDAEGLDVLLRYFDGDEADARRRFAPLLEGGGRQRPMARMLRLACAEMSAASGDTVAERDHLELAADGGGDLLPAEWARARLSERFDETPAAAAFPSRVRVRTALALALGAAVASGFMAWRVAAGAHVDALDLELALAPASQARDAELFAEAARVASAEAELLPERPGVRDTYFVAFAGYHSQDVFQREVEAAASLMDQRFDTKGRSIVLANRGEHPRASSVALAHVLAAVGARMNREEDLLFLYATSHGSESGLALEFPRGSPYDEVSLSPSALADALRAAGIRRRVLVLAGCSTGVFVAPLKDEDSVVLTASAPDRFSYGCANGRPFTDFGRTLFEDVLPHERSLPIAFRDVVEATSDREARTSVRPSLPQLFVGDRIRAWLDATELGK